VGASPVFTGGEPNVVSKIMRIVQKRGDDGASAVEYGLLVAGIAALIVTVVFLFGGVVKKSFSSTCGKLSAGSAATSASSCG
jgi:pilus assembly protein Flp/PilA